MRELIVRKTKVRKKILFPRVEEDNIYKIYESCPNTNHASVISIYKQFINNVEIVETVHATKGTVKKQKVCNCGKKKFGFTKGLG